MCSNTNDRNCPICVGRRQRNTTEIFVLTEGPDRHFFNVEKAKKLVASHRAPLAISADTIKQLLAINEYESVHLDHVDPEQPGILALRYGGLVLLDGVHRAARCLREGKMFHAYMLSHEESQACIVREDIFSKDPSAIVQKLRRVLDTVVATDAIEAAIDCSEETLEEVRRLLTEEENRRIILRRL